MIISKESFLQDINDYNAKSGLSFFDMFGYELGAFQYKNGFVAVLIISARHGEVRSSSLTVELGDYDYAINLIKLYNAKVLVLFQTSILFKVDFIEAIKQYANIRLRRRIFKRIYGFSIVFQEDVSETEVVLFIVKKGGVKYRICLNYARIDKNAALCRVLADTTFIQSLCKKKYRAGNA